MTTKKWSQPKGKQKTGIGSNEKTEPEVGNTVLFEPNGITYRITGIVKAHYKRDKYGKHVITAYQLTKGNSTIEASPDEIRW